MKTFLYCLAMVMIGSFISSSNIVVSMAVCACAYACVRMVVATWVLVADITTADVCGMCSSEICECGVHDTMVVSMLEHISTVLYMMTYSTCTSTYYETMAIVWAGSMGNKARNSVYTGKGSIVVRANKYRVCMNKQFIALTPVYAGDFGNRYNTKFAYLPVIDYSSVSCLSLGAMRFQRLVDRLKAVLKGCYLETRVYTGPNYILECGCQSFCDCGYEAEQYYAAKSKVEIELIEARLWAIYDAKDHAHEKAWTRKNKGLRATLKKRTDARKVLKASYVIWAAEAKAEQEAYESDTAARKRDANNLRLSKLRRTKILIDR